MSRGFWAAIGAIAGFFIGGFIGEAIGMARAHKLGLTEAAASLAAIGSVIGIPWGFAIAWSLAGRTQRQR
jgi:hypothetical protein